MFYERAKVHIGCCISIVWKILEDAKLRHMVDYKWDFFISHASEDKANIVRPLAERLQNHGLRVWFDEQQILIGDSLRRRIDEGLSRSRFGIVILSPSFFAKDWPQKELDALASREIGNEKVILPIWHELTEADVAYFSPLLADRKAVSTSEGLDRVVDEILRKMNLRDLEYESDKLRQALRAVAREVAENIDIDIGKVAYGTTKQEVESDIKSGIETFALSCLRNFTFADSALTLGRLERITAYYDSLGLDTIITARFNRRVKENAALYLASNIIKSNYGNGFIAWAEIGEEIICADVFSMSDLKPGDRRRITRDVLITDSSGKRA